MEFCFNTLVKIDGTPALSSVINMQGLFQIADTPRRVQADKSSLFLKKLK